MRTSEHSFLRIYFALNPAMRATLKSVIGIVEDAERQSSEYQAKRMTKTFYRTAGAQRLVAAGGSQVGC